jgi:hypothetical protein
MTQSNIDHSFSYITIQPAAGRLFSLIIPLKKSAKNKVPRRSQRLCGECNIVERNNRSV